MFLQIDGFEESRHGDKPPQCNPKEIIMDGNVPTKLIIRVNCQFSNLQVEARHTTDLTQSGTYRDFRASPKPALFFFREAGDHDGNSSI
jgi:hypothetical protein